MKNNFVPKKSFALGKKFSDVEKTSLCCTKKCSMSKKKLMLHKNCISCRQEQYDAAQEKKNCAQKIYSFF